MSSHFVDSMRSVDNCLHSCSHCSGHANRNLLRGIKPALGRFHDNSFDLYLLFTIIVASIFRM